MLLGQVAKRYGIAVATGYNRNRDPHAVAAPLPFVVTIHRQRTPQSPPRAALYRIMLARLGDMAQSRLPLVEFGYDAEARVIVITDEIKPEYVIIGHGPNKRHGREIGFVTANFVGRDGRFLGRHVDFLSLFGTVAEEIATTETDTFKIKPREEEHGEEGAR